ncbi:MAG: septal ring lytic transglycosylase RlpA family protein [Candidatus Marinimicrobia bacterium]|jgi:rare lipoprotein A (peptidoglycan hydrolase)|nr:septal ring lytic transglycosylase RlpA family protein [Candidatus Neomarinimicrobiota bacterium]MBT3675794.1 septal ring lytic transglycosylase RlpA family protein [Candidatus Neomarinimicrobiota bacterium]MBT3762956.1 septal ring lytic transglycosylase RlpA family protein [Candidatus Neomarinimicrobiota bacterium]MBT4069103.1 septal ring lytic transglycosylase RlpA family protein [Candidatus Neomarinimicrobiota bacterium]MBT4271489.1 septal ring lytic transglycosylase RlpA family protein [
MKKLCLIIFVLSLVNGCSNSPRYRTGPVKLSSSKTKKNPPALKTKSTVKHRKVMTGVSSFYAEDFHGKLTANGEVYDMYGVTAAHKTLPLNTIARVTNLENNKSLILRINDRGPYVKGRILDCSYGAAKKLDFVNNGTAKVKIEVIEWGDNKYMKHRN